MPTLSSPSVIPPVFQKAYTYIDLDPRYVSTQLEPTVI
jgi:hypothetical protein